MRGSFASNYEEINFIVRKITAKFKGLFIDNEVYACDCIFLHLLPDLLLLNRCEIFYFLIIKEFTNINVAKK